MSKIKSVIAAAALLAATLGFSSGAQAVLLTYNFSGIGSNGTTLMFSQSGVTLQARGSFNNTAATIVDGANGLGIAGNGSDQLNGPAVGGQFEEIEFDLPAGAMWVRVAIGDLNNGERIGSCGSNVGFNNCNSGVQFVNGATGTDPQIIDLSGIANSPVASVFFQNNNSFGGAWVQSITIDAPVAIPEPAVIGLLGLGLAGLGLARRRRSVY